MGATGVRGSDPLRSNVFGILAGGVREELHHLCIMFRAMGCCFYTSQCMHSEITHRIFLRPGLHADTDGDTDGEHQP